MKLSTAIRPSSDFMYGASFLALAIALTSHWTPAVAEEPVAREGKMLEEIVVSATKRGIANIQDLPMAIQAIGGDKLAERVAVDFNDYFRMISGLAVYDQGTGDKRYIVRGVNATGAGTVGLYLDEIIITGENAQDGGGRQPDVRLFDIDRVEVLKGPQGSTFGSSSLSGTIRYITRKPVLGEVSGYAQAGAEYIDGGNAGWQTQGALNLPVGEKVAVRVSGLYQDSAGYIDSMFADNVNAPETKAVRAIALIEPTENLRLTFMAMHQKVDTDGQAYFNLQDYTGNPLSQNGDYTQADIVENGFEDKMNLFNATLEYEMSWATLTATASRFERDSVFQRDSSLVMERFVGRPSTGTGRSVITQPKDRTLDSFEVRLASNTASRLQYLVGLFHQKEDRAFRTAIYPAPNGQAQEVSGYSLSRAVDTSISEYAIFGEIAFDITDALTLTAGGRYFDFNIDEIANSISTFGGTPGTGVGNPLGFTEDGAIFKGNLSYKVHPDHLVYIQAAEGFRPGGTNDQVAAQLAGVAIPTGFGSDSLISYEAGYKSTFLDGRVRFNLAAYLIEWDNIQLQAEVFGPGGRFPYRANGGGAEIKGLEVDLSLKPLPEWELTFSSSLVNAELTEDNPIPSTGMKGDNIPYVPDFTASVSTRYEWNVGSLMAHIAGDVTYVDGRGTEYRPTSASFVELEDYTLVNLRIGLGDNDAGWQASVYANNITNNDSQIDVFRVVAGLYPDGVIINRPRTVGLSLKKSFP